MRRLMAFICTAAALPAFADAPVIEGAEATRSGTGWRISVTVSHGDTGWEHYADGWRIEAPDGTELGMRVLAHPHVNEQPFTRSLSDVGIPDALDRVRIRARDNHDGWAEESFELRLPK